MKDFSSKTFQDENQTAIFSKTQNLVISSLHLNLTQLQSQWNQWNRNNDGKSGLQFIHKH